LQSGIKEDEPNLVYLLPPNPRPEGPLSIHCGAYFPSPLIKVVGTCDIHGDTGTDTKQ